LPGLLGAPAAQSDQAQTWWCCRGSATSWPAPRTMDAERGKGWWAAWPPVTGERGTTRRKAGAKQLYTGQDLLGESSNAAEKTPFERCNAAFVNRGVTRGRPRLTGALRAGDRAAASSSERRVVAAVASRLATAAGQGRGQIEIWRGSHCIAGIEHGRRCCAGGDPGGSGSRAIFCVAGGACGLWQCRRWRQQQQQQPPGVGCPRAVPAAGLPAPRLLLHGAVSTRLWQEQTGEACGAPLRAPRTRVHCFSGRECSGGPWPS